MNLLHRHILANVFLTCAASVGLFAFVLMLGNAMKDLLGPMLAGQLALETVVRLVALLVPFVVYYALPMGMLTGILLVLGRMSSDREITAMRASGLSVAWLSAPIIFLALLGVVLSLLINFQFMPVARLAYQREFAEAVRQNPLSFIVPRTFIRDFPGVVLYVGEKDGERLKDFWIWELDGQNRVRRFARAESGLLDYSDDNSTLVLTLERAQVEVRDPKDPENFSKHMISPGSDVLPIDLPVSRLAGDRSVKRKLKWLTFPQLLAEWARLKQPDATVPAAERAQQLMRVQITIQEKAAMAFAVLSFALIAIPLGIKISRKETSANLGLGLLLAMGYYFATIMAGWLDNRPELRPDLIVWLPNIVFQGIGLWLFYRVDRS
ncbi:putative permease YjgP/YjgQ family protein [Lacunisphaera limnophila]|uniref:Putative permease YjgP/YjgQ family protein n=1 Tax=Lacunisphaera limnophila TaxID=1838286 RepID=A0A1D8AWM2_9BACT|nr:LptF/LptG family permease [Lacunisphaera limnophila]AOS45285.1 putative permease YjgP/YjgQ family protein [Lacunisphaera limnophila]